MIYRIGPFQLDTRTDTLFRGGEPLPLGRRAVGLFRVLLDNAGTVLSKDDLMESVWSGLTVEEGNLTVQIASLRKVLGEEPQGYRWIETLPRRGYRYIGPAVVKQNFNTSGVIERDLAMPALPPLKDRLEKPDPRPAERRQLTVLACEFVRAAALSAQVDAEALRDAMEAQHRQCQKIIESHHGRIANRLPDGLIAYFGEPQATGYDAEYALRAALRLLELMGECTSSGNVTFQLRIGIASGLVIMDHGIAGIGERSAVGEAPNLAGLLKALGDPGDVIVAAGTRNLVRGLFEYRDFRRVAHEGL